MRTTIIICYLILTSKLIFSQVDYQVRHALDLYKTHKLVSGDWKNWLEESEIDGSPYLNNEFVKGDVFMNSQNKFIDVLLRYNIYNDQIEFKNGDEIQALSPPDLIDKIEFEGNTFEYIAFSIGKKIKKGFFIRLNEGKAKLYKRPEIQFKNAEEAGAYKDAEPAKFIRKPDAYYIRINDAQGQKAIKSKSLPDLFPDKRTELADFIKKNNTRVNSEEDLLKLVEFYNSL